VVFVVPNTNWFVTGVMLKAEDSVFAPAIVCIQVVITHLAVAEASGTFNVIVHPNHTGEAHRPISVPVVPVANVIVLSA
jgi:hypothetical protein